MPQRFKCRHSASTKPAHSLRGFRSFGVLLLRMEPSEFRGFFIFIRSPIWSGSTRIRCVHSWMCQRQQIRSTEKGNREGGSSESGQSLAKDLLCGRKSPFLLRAQKKNRLSTSTVDDGTP